MDGVNLNEDAVQIQMVINTLESVSVPATYDNVNKLAGIYRTLAELRDRLSRPAADGAPET